MSARADSLGDAPTGSVEFFLAQLTDFVFPFGHGTKTVPDEQSAPRGGGHPGGNADAFVSRRGEDLCVHIGTNSDGELW